MSSPSRSMMAIAMLAFASIPSAALSSTIETTLDVLIDVSSDVLVVTVTEGRTNSNGGDCGFVYTAKVNKQFKGKTQEDIEFGTMEGLSIGKTYFLALYDRNAYIAERTGILNFTFANHSEDERKRAMTKWNGCQKFIPRRMVGGWELGAMPVVRAPDIDYKIAVKVPLLSIRIPSGTICTQAASVDQYDRGLDTVWVTLPEMERVTMNAIERKVGATQASDKRQNSLTFRECAIPDDK